MIKILIIRSEKNWDIFSSLNSFFFPQVNYRISDDLKIQIWLQDSTDIICCMQQECSFAGRLSGKGINFSRPA